MNTPIVKARVHTGIANTIDRACDNADNGLHTTAIRILAAGLGDLSRLLCKLAPDLDITSGGEVVEECQTCEGALFIEAIRAEPSSCGTTLVRLPCPECNAQPAPVATPTSTPPPAPEVSPGEALKPSTIRAVTGNLRQLAKHMPKSLPGGGWIAEWGANIIEHQAARILELEKERDEALEKLEGADKTPDGALIAAANAMQAAFLKTLYEIIPDTAAGERDERWDVIQAYTDALKRIGTEEYRAARMATTTPPAAPCEMCGGRGEVAGHEPDGSWDTRPCPDCAPPAAPSELAGTWSVEADLRFAIQGITDCGPVVTTSAVLRLMNAAERAASALCAPGSELDEVVTWIPVGRAPEKGAPPTPDDMDGKWHSVWLADGSIEPGIWCFGSESWYGANGDEFDSPVTHWTELHGPALTPLPASPAAGKEAT